MFQNKASSYNDVHQNINAMVPFTTQNPATIIQFFNTTQARSALSLIIVLTVSNYDFLS